MSGLFSSYADKAIAAVDRNRAALTRSTARLTEHDAARPAGDDADQLFTWRRERRDLEDRIESDKEALTFAEAVAAKARDEQAEREADAEHGAEGKAARADEKLARDLDAALRKAAEIRDKLAASVARTCAYNQRRGDRPFILDAETRIRQKPGRIIPAEFRDDVVWQDGAGNQPSEYRERDGELVPVQQGFVKKTVRVQTRAEQVIPAQTPESFTTALHLVNLAGQKL